MPEINADITAGDAGEILCRGAWTLASATRLEPLLDRWTWPSAGEVVIDTAAVTAMDTAGAWLLHRTVRMLQQRGCTAHLRGLRLEFQTLLQLIATRAPALGPSLAPKPGFLARIGQQSWRGLLGAAGMLAFIGECVNSLRYVIAQPHRLRWRHILYNLQTAGFQALPITGLLSFLMPLVKCAPRRRAMWRRF